MNVRLWRTLTLLTLSMLLVTSGIVRAAATVQIGEAETGTEDLAAQAAVLLGAAHEASDVGAVRRAGGWKVREITATGSDLVVCLDVATEVLAARGWQGMEEVQAAIRLPLEPLSWESLSVQAWDLSSSRCRPLSDFAPQPTTDRNAIVTAEEIRLALRNDRPAVATEAADYPASLAGKTVYISAGHGWSWNGRQWRTQRPVYEGFIEDHNNAEVVTQLLIPYLENAGATVVPMRERDWASQAAIADNDRGAPEYTKSGAWFTGGSGTGYAGGSYQYAISTNGTPNAVVTWSMTIAKPGEYAVYAWVYPGSNRVPDAHYVVNHAGGSTEVLLDQRIFPNTWRYLGTFPFHAGTATVTLDNRTSSGGAYAVIADAVRIGGGTFDSFAGIPATTTLPVNPSNPTTPPASAPMKPWWESSTFYWSQWSGLNPYDWSYYNDVVARPIYSRWHQRSNPGDAVYVSWHTNGYNGNNTTIRGTVSYAHNGDTYPRTDGSLELQAAVHNELIHDIRTGWDSAWTDRGKGKLNLGELRMLWDPDVPSARIPGVLLEIAYHDNYEDALALKDPGFNRLAARAVYQGIVSYFEALDGRDLVLLPEPPSHLRVVNAGDGRLHIAWNASPTDSHGLGGDPAAGYHVYTSSDGLGWGSPQVVAGTSINLDGLSLGETVYVQVTAINNGGESMATEVLGARVGNAPLLLVSGFDRLNRFGLVYENDPVEHGNLRMWIDQMNSFNYVVHHGDALPSEIAWDSTSNEAITAGLVDLSAYDVIDWILGEETTSVDGTLNASERAALDGYLSLDRALLISGSELGWELVERGGAPAFLREVLHTDYLADDAGTYQVRPDPGGAFAGLGDLRFDAADEYLADYPDVFAPLGGAQTAMRYVGGDGDGKAAAVQYADGCRRLLVLGFPFETLRTEMRAGVMAKALAFLAVCAGEPTDTAIILPEDGAGYAAISTASGSAVGRDLTAVWLQLARTQAAGGQSVAYWTGSGWGATELWFPATGTAAWSYALPVLDEGVYRLAAYADGPEPDTTPAEVSFWIDRTAPQMPTIVTPTDGITVTGPIVELEWTGPIDAGSSVHFEVDIDGTVAKVTGSPYSVAPALRPGAHRWRLRAVDAAANASAWTAWAYFNVEVAQTFVPVVLRD